MPVNSGGDQSGKLAHPGWGSFVPPKKPAKPATRTIVVKEHTRTIKASGSANAGSGVKATGNVAKGNTPKPRPTADRKPTHRIPSVSGTAQAGIGVKAQGNVGKSHDTLKKFLPSTEAVSVARDVGRILGAAHHVPGLSQGEDALSYLLLRKDKGLPGVIHAGANAVGSYVAKHPPTFYGTGGGPVASPSNLLGGRPSGLGGPHGAVVGGNQVSPQVAKYLGDAFIGGVDVFGQIAPSMAYAVGPATQGNAAETGRRFARPYTDIVTDPKKAFSGRNVVGTSLLLGGAYGTLGRAAGTAARSGVLGKRAAASAETLQGVASHPHSGAEENVRVSKNLATAAVQKRAIRSGAAKAQKLRAEADALEARGTPQGSVEARNKRIEADRVDPYTITNQSSARLTATSVRPVRGQVNRLVDERQAFDHAIGVSSRSDALRATDTAVKHGLSRAQAPLVRLVAEGEHASHAGIKKWLDGVKTNLRDMVAEDVARRNAGERPINTARIQKAHENVNLVEKALGKTKDWTPVLAAANELSRLHNAILEPKMAAASILDPAQMDRARHFTGTLRRDAGYQFNDQPIPTPTALAERGARHARQDAERAYVKAGRAVQQARRVRDQAVADARVSAGKVHRTPALVKAERDLARATSERAAAERAVTTARVGSAGTEAAAVVRQGYRERSAGRGKNMRPATAAAKKAAAKIVPERAGNKVLNAGVKERQAQIALDAAKKAEADAHARLSNQRGRSRGVDPANHDKLIRSITELDKAREAATVARAKVEAAAAEHQAAKKAAAGKAKTTTPSILDASGKPVSTDQMIADFNRIAKGGGYVDSPVHLSQQPNLKGREGRRSDFYSNPYEAASASDGVRSGSAYDKGFIDLHPEALRAGAARKAKLVNNARAFKSLVTDWAYREKGTDASSMTIDRTYGAAQRRAEVIYAKSGRKYVPVALEPFATKSHTLLEAIKDESVLGPDHLDAATYDRLSGAFDKNAPADKWVLLPEDVANRTKAHMDALRGGALIKGVQRLNSIFRRSVLYRPTWIMGNAFEGTYRGLLTRALPGLSPEWWLLRRIYDQMGPGDARNVLQARSGATHGDFVQRQPKRSSDQLVSTHGRRGEVIENVMTSDATNKAMHAIDRVNHAWFSQINGFFEDPLRGAQYAKAASNHAGLSMRQRASAYPLVNKAFPETFSRAAKQFLDGQVHTRDQIEVARLVDRAYGKYDKFTPGMRSAIATVTPFVAWTMNAITFCLRTLPRDHPLLTSIMASASLTSQDWRLSQGLGGGHYAGRLPDFLQGTVPGKGGSHLTTFKHFTPHGVMTDPLGTLSSAFAPQAEGILKAMAGYDWKNKPLKNPDGSDYDTTQRLMYILKEGGKTFTPAGVVTQFNSKGGSLKDKIDHFLTGSMRYTQSKARPGGSGTTTTGGTGSGSGWGSGGSSSSTAHSGWGSSGGSSRSTGTVSSGWGMP